jgi:site-specific DNA recombinase
VSSTAGAWSMARTTWDYRKGRKFKVAAPESEWIVVERPELRIVSEELWQDAHRRLERTRQTYLRLTNGKVWGRPESGIESNYLLTGFLECAGCGGGL